MMESILNWLGGIPSIGVFLQNKYVFSLLILVVFGVAAKLLLFVFARVIEKFTKNTKTKLDDLVVEKTKSPLFFLILAYGLKLAILNLELGEGVTKAVNSVMAVVFVWIVISVIEIAIDAWGMTFAKKTKTKIDDVLLPLFQKAAKVAFVIVALLWVLKIWNINIGPYLAGAGILGLVLGMALQDSLKNILGGVTLILDKTYHVGDKVKLETGEVGTIHDIGLRSTKLITFDNEIVYIPNGYLANSRVQNYTHPSPKIRVNIKFGVEYGSDVQKVKKVVLDSVKKMKDILDDPEPQVDFLEMGDFALSFVARFWVEEWGNAWGKKLEATENIYDALNKAGIGIPFPTQTLYLKKDNIK